MNRPRLLPLSICFAVSLVCTPADAADQWIALFNGHDLSNWNANVYPDSFQVVQLDDGPAIKAHCTSQPHRSHLFFVGDTGRLVKFDNFELVVTFRGEPSSNSGVFFHTDMSTRDEKLHLAKGYEVNMNNSAKEKQKTGSLYAVVGINDPAIDDTQWTKLHLTVQGKHIVVRIDDKKVVDYVEPDDVKRPTKRSGRLIDPRGGAIALQAHDPDSVYYFKDIRIRRL
tara:strand:+ start:52077 stop:52754 length:678 start_codon:yes stop_codon:yes gene_type:complete